MSHDFILPSESMPVPPRSSRQGIAIPLVLLFVFCILVFASAMFLFRKEVKQENVVNINFLQANFLAQAGIQHALLKCRVLPQDAYDAGVAQKGFCPFQGIISGTNPSPGSQKTDDGMVLFASDCRSDTAAGLPWGSGLSVDGTQWKYEVASISVISAYTDQADNMMVLSVQIISRGSVFDPRGGRGWRTEEMIKTIEITRPQN